MLWASCAVMAGIYFAEYYEKLIPTAVWLIVCLCGVLMLKAANGKQPWIVTLIPMALLMGIGLWHYERLQVLDLTHRNGQMVTLEGQAYGLEGLGNTIRLTAVTLQCGEQTISLRRDVRLRLKGRGTVPQGLNGSRIVVRTLWQPAESQVNPRGFDYGDYLNRLGYQTELRVSSWQIVHRQPGRADPRTLLYAFRSWYGRSLLRLLPLSEGSVAYGMAIGDTALIPGELKDSYRISGLGHLLSVSGMHFAILYGWLRRMLKATPFKDGAQTGIAIAVLTFMGFLNGWAAPALRAWGMILLLILSRCCFRRYDGVTALSGVALLTAMIKPLSVLQPGFQFSYCAVLALMTLTRPLEARLPVMNPHLREYLGASIAVQCAVMPLGIFWFGFFNPLTLLTNFPVMLLAEWLMPVLVIFPVLMLLGPAVEGAASVVIGLLIRGINACSLFMTHRAEDWLLPSPSAGRLAALMLMLVLAARLVIPAAGGSEQRLRSHRLILTAVALLIGVRAAWVPGGEITFFSVGQGDAALIRFEHHIVLVDTGPEKAELDRLLLRNGIGTLDTLAITHGHEDHIGGAVAILRHLKVGQVVIGAEEPDNPLYIAMLQEAAVRNVPVVRVKQGDALYSNAFRSLMVLYPEEDRPQSDPNAHSLTLLYREAAFNTLFTGDLTRAGEAAQLQAKVLPPVQLVKVPHHGSRTSSSESWLNHIAPETAVISVGPNLYGLPNRDIMEAYRSVGAELYRTDENGAVQVTLRGGQGRLRTWR